MTPCLRYGLGTLLVLCCAGGADWRPAKGPLMTRWAKDVSPERVHAEYPRPQLVRSQWQNLNGLWELAITKGTLPSAPAKFDRQILVPFPIESALSRVMLPAEDVWYRRTFKLNNAWRQRRVILHFGAVDWEATVSVNGQQIGTHRGGYDGFSFDITDALRPGEEQELTVRVWDPTSHGDQPRGKQVDRPDGIYYTPTTGIWQTVWLEPVSEAGIERLKLVPDVDAGLLRLTAEGTTAKHLTVEAVAREGQLQVGRVKGKLGETLAIKIPDAKRWSPQHPFLYDLEITVAEGDKVLDRVTSYFGMRKIEVVADEKGQPRMMLNGEPVFQVGPLDQGFWPDGLYTAPTDEALRYDVEITRRLGFNMTRKHVKVEPDRWYYWCDKLGLLVWQDMPSGDNKSPESKVQYEHELHQMVTGRWNHPSIILWVVFNEGWGQFDTERLTNEVKQLDPSRLTSNASGWTDKRVGDLIDVHVYPGPGAPTAESKRASVLGEFGGLSLGVDGHTWSKKTWGYQGTSSKQELTTRYDELLSGGWVLRDSAGLSALVYTQLTDVETEANGLLTYDREVLKVDRRKAAAANRGRFGKVSTLVATSQTEPQNWRYTLAQPAADWMKPEFDAASWKSGPGGFGTAKTPGAVVRTEWDTPDIWLRREFTVDEKFTATQRGELAASIHHDDSTEVYINGVLALEAKDYVADYGILPIRPQAVAALKPGKNVLAVHCHQNAGGQYIDVGLLASQPRPTPARRPWTSLFDGQTLGKWQPTKFGGEGEVEVKDKQIVLGHGNELTGITYGAEPPERIDYELKLDAMRVDGHDFFCALTFPVGDDPCSLIIGGWGGGVVGLSSLDGLDAARNQTTKYVEFENGRWYHIRLRVSQKRIEAWVDRDKLVDVDTTGRKISIRGEVELSRPLGIATYSTTGALKNIKIRPLAKASESPAEAKPDGK